MPRFDLYCKTDALRQRLVPLLAQIPPFFTFTVRTGTPEIRILSATDPLWLDYPHPVQEGVAYVFDDEIRARAVGGGGGMRASARVCPGDDDEVLVLRLWHELLHAVNQPADDMVPLADEWQTSLDRFLWTVWHWFGYPIDCPFWQRRRYPSLAERAALSD